MSNSECEDDPINSSDDDKRPVKVSKDRTRKSSRLSKRAKVITNYTSSDEDSQSAKVVKKTTKSRKKSAPVKLAPVIVKEEKPQTRTAPTSFTHGAFVVSKRDAQNYDSKKPPIIWRIDGKALLQKFEPFKEQGQFRYRNTSVYTGWSDLETENYAVMKTVNFINNTSHRVEITLKMNEFRNIITDSE